RSDVERRALVKLRWRDVENALGAVRRRSPGLLDDEGERVRLVEQAQLAARRLAVRRIGEDAAAEKVAVEVGDERADVARAERRVVALEAFVVPHQRTHAVVPELFVGVVDREIPASF